MYLTWWSNGTVLASFPDFGGSSLTIDFLSFFIILLKLFWAEQGERGFESWSKMAFPRRSAALMGPPFSFPAHKVVYGQFLWFGGSWRKLVKSFSFRCSPMLKRVQKYKNLSFSKFPRANLKIKLQGSTHIKPVPPRPLPYLQVPMTIYNHF